MKACGGKVRPSLNGESARSQGGVKSITSDRIAQQLLLVLSFSFIQLHIVGQRLVHDRRHAPLLCVRWRTQHTGHQPAVL